MDSTEKLARVRLARANRVGPALYQDLLNRFGSAETALTELTNLARHAKARTPPKPLSIAAAKAQLAAIEAMGGTTLVLGEVGYPALLAAIRDPAPVLTLLGARHLLEKPAFAIVGTRRASAAARTIARRLARDMGAADWVVVSGMALGVDAAAHEGSLETGTIAVLAGGADVVYPAEHAALYDKIRRQGLIVAEQPPGTAPQRQMFPRRNRIISGLALGTTVVEADLRSGSMITARYAADQGREIFAVPLSPMDPRSRGGIQLLRDGAHVLETAQDALEVLAPARGHALRAQQTPDLFAPVSLAPRADAPPIGTITDAAREDTFALLAPHPTPLDDVVAASSLNLRQTLAAIAELEIAGRAEREPNGDIIATIPNKTD